MEMKRTDGPLHAVWPLRLTIFALGVVLASGPSCSPPEKNEDQDNANSGQIQVGELRSEPFRDGQNSLPAKPSQLLKITLPTRCLTLPPGGHWPWAMRRMPDGRTKLLFTQRESDQSLITHGVVHSLPDGVKDQGFVLDSQGDPALSLHSAAFSPDGTLLVVQGYTSKTGLALYLCDATTGKTKSIIFDGDLRKCNHVIFSPDGTLIACNGIEKQTAAIYDVAKGEWGQHKFRQQQFSVELIAFSPDSKILATAGGLGEINLWDIKSGRLVRTVTDKPEGALIGMAFSPDGRLLAVGVCMGEDRCDILLYDPSTGKQVGALVGHTQMMNFAFRKDSRLLVSSSQDGTLKFWDVRQRKMIHEIVFTGHMYCVAFSPDDRWLIAEGVMGDPDGVIVFDMHGKLKEKAPAKR